MAFEEFDFVTLDVPQAYCEEPRGKFHGNWLALARPRDEAELQAVLAMARSEGVGVVPYGGGTGLMGGQIYPEADGALCLSLENFKELKIEGDTVLVGAGVVLEELHQALKGTGFHFPLSLASSASAQIGGLISTNAGGVHVLRHGNMGEQVLGLRAILADGRVVDQTRNLRKDNTGFRLDRLMIGAEGVLGIVTKARLKLVVEDVALTTILAQVNSPKDAFEILGALKNAPTPINAFELISKTTWELREEAGFEATPIGAPNWSVLIEMSGGVETLEVVADQLGEHVIAKSEADRATIWALRESVPLANRKIGSIASHDIALPLERVVEFIEIMPDKLGAIDDVRINGFGHMGDGNLHYNLFAAKGRDRADYDAARLSDCVYETVVKMGGSISAEHGVGRAKGALMRRLGQGEKLDLMREVKRALDPENLLNPGVFFEAE